MATRRESAEMDAPYCSACFVSTLETSSPLSGDQSFTVRSSTVTTNLELGARRTARIGVPCAASRAPCGHSLRNAIPALALPPGGVTCRISGRHAWGECRRDTPGGTRKVGCAR